MYKAIFWDNDGILVHTEPLYFEANRRVLKDIGINLTRDYYSSCTLRTNAGCFDLAKEKGFNDDEILSLRIKRNDIYTEILKHNVPVMDGVRETLDTLYGKLTMGMVTGSKRDHLDIILESNGFRKYFDFIITIEDVKKGKPNPEAYLLALEKTGLPAENCLVVEDTERGLTAAKGANLSCYAIPHELSKTNDFSKADKVLNSAKEIPGLVLQD